MRTPTPGQRSAVTRWAFYTLPPTHLEAALAHELGHHLGGGDWVSLLEFLVLDSGSVCLDRSACPRPINESACLPSDLRSSVGFVLIGYLGCPAGGA